MILNPSEQIRWMWFWTPCQCSIKTRPFIKSHKMDERVFNAFKFLFKAVVCLFHGGKSALTVANKSKLLTLTRYFFVWSVQSTQSPSLFSLSAEEREHPLHLRCGRRGEGRADRGRRGAVRRPVAHGPGAQERLSHGAPGRRQPPQGHPASHPGLWRSQRFNLFPWRDPTWTCSAENCSRWGSTVF